MLIADISKTAEILLGCLISLVSLIFGFVTIRNWIRGEPIRSRWNSGAPMSRVGQLSGSGFLVFLGLSLIVRSAWPIVPAMAFFIVGLTSQTVDTNRYKKMRTATRGANASKYPEVFQEQVQDLDADELPHRPSFRIFDEITASYLGELSREQLHFLIRWHGPNLEGEKHNNFFIIDEILDSMEKDGADPRMVEMLRKAVAKNEIILLWTSR